MLLGDSEAVVAVAQAPGLTEALAERDWWAMQDFAYARVMLINPQILVFNALLFTEFYLLLKRLK